MRDTRLRASLALGIAASLPALAFLSCGRESLVRESKLTMGTVVEITVSASSEREARAAIREAFEEMQRIDDLMSSHRPESVISQVNREGFGRPVVVGNEAFQVIRDAVAIGESSGGAFDITLWPLSQLWGFEKEGKVPPAGAIRSLVEHAGYRQVALDEATLSVGLKNASVGIDLGGIAKGWAVDRAIARLQARGVRNAIVDAGGDLRVIGGRPGRGTWRIGVQHPRESGQLLLTLDLSDTAIVTSGDYERFFTEDGVRYHHILDPATGMPARGCQSVTVLAPTAAEADACATAAFVLGPERGLAFLRARPGVRGVIVGADASLHWTDEGLERMARR